MSLTTAHAAAPPPSVLVMPVEIEDVAPVQTFPGQVQAIQTVTIVARVSAFLEKVAFEEGSMVKTGQLLYQLQQGPYQAAVEQAQGALAQAQATLRNAQLNYERDAKAGNLAISAQQLQQDVSARDVAQGQVDAARGTLENAAINLSYCTVVAPIDGQIGRTQYTVGNLVSPTSGPLATIVQLDPIRVAFSVSDAQLVEVEQTTGMSRDQLFKLLTLDVQLPNGAAYSHPGKIEFLNNQVETTTATLTVWGRFDNPDKLLVPGAYVTVAVHRTTPEKHPVVPVQAVQDDQQGRFVLVVGADNKVEQRTVKTGRQIGQDYIVESGLSGGERVITEGIQKVHPGEVVNPSAPTTGPNGAPQGASQQTPQQASQPGDGGSQAGGGPGGSPSSGG